MAFLPKQKKIYPGVLGVLDTRYTRLGVLDHWILDILDVLCVNRHTRYARYALPQTTIQQQQELVQILYTSFTYRHTRCTRCTSTRDLRKGYPWIYLGLRVLGFTSGIQRGLSLEQHKSQHCC